MFKLTNASHEISAGPQTNTVPVSEIRWLFVQHMWLRSYLIVLSELVHFESLLLPVGTWTCIICMQERLNVHWNEERKNVHTSASAETSWKTLVIRISAEIPHRALWFIKESNVHLSLLTHSWFGSQWPCCCIAVCLFTNSLQFTWCPQCSVSNIKICGDFAPPSG